MTDKLITDPIGSNHQIGGTICKNKEFLVAKMLIATTQIKHFDSNNIDFGIRKRCLWQSKMKICEKFCVHECHLSGVDKTRSLNFSNTDLSNL